METMALKINKRISEVLGSSTLAITAKAKELKAEGKKLIASLDAWDKKMIQRKSKAYDDVENFPNKFTAEYLFLINQSNSGIPRVNQSSKDRKAELDAQWVGLKQKAESFINSDIPDFNAKLWSNGIGAIRI